MDTSILEQAKKQAQADQRAAVGDLLDQKTRDMLVRFGTRTALSGGNIGQPLRLGG